MVTKHCVSGHVVAANHRAVFPETHFIMLGCHGLADLQAQEHGDVVAGTALAGLLAAHDGIHQADADLEAASHFGLAQTMFVKPLLGLLWGVGWGFHGFSLVWFGGGKLVA